MRQTIKQLLQQAYRQIDKLDADLLLSFILGKPREYFIIYDDEIISDFAKNKFNKLVKKRKNGAPIAYITGHKEFFGLDFLVNKYTLIPRPDTELLVEQIILTINKEQLIPRHSSGSRLYVGTTNKFTLIDVGTGTGCIPISVIKTLKHKNIKTFAIDISKSALAIARKNAKKHKVKIKFLYGSLLKPFPNSKFQIPNSNIIITANLPYLTEKQYKDEPSIKHEPKSALVAKKEGLALYEKLLHQVKQLNNLVPSPQSLVPTIFLEIDPSQSEKIKILIKKILPNTKVEIKKDLAKRDRVVIIT